MTDSSARMQAVHIWLTSWRPFVITARPGGSDHRIEYRADQYDGADWDGSPAQRLHDALDGMHSCILHAEGGPFAVLPRHSDWDRVVNIVARDFA